MRNKIAVVFAFVCVLFLSASGAEPNDEKQPKTITRTAMVVNGMKVETTLIVLDANTSREDLIHTCNFLAKENVQLAFDKLTIGKSFLGLVGKSRIRTADGKIQLPNGITQRFKAGGLTSFQFIKIQYSNKEFQGASQIEMIEIID